MTALIIDRSAFFAMRRTDNDIARVRAIANREVARYEAAANERRERIEAYLQSIGTGARDEVAWRYPSDGEVQFGDAS